MNRKGLNQLFTDEVKKYLDNGFQIRTDDMSGSQGEIAHVDLTDGSEIIRILMEVKSADFQQYGDMLEIRVGRVVDPRVAKGYTIWNNELETISEIKFDRIRDDYYVSPEEGRRMCDVRYNRAVQKDIKHISPELGDAFKSAALRWIRRQPRMKGVRIDDIKSMVRIRCDKGGVCYRILARGKTLYLESKKRRAV